MQAVGGARIYVLTLLGLVLFAFLAFALPARIKRVILLLCRVGLAPGISTHFSYERRVDRPCGRSERIAVPLELFGQPSRAQELLQLSNQVGTKTRTAHLRRQTEGDGDLLKLVSGSGGSCRFLRFIRALTTGSCNIRLGAGWSVDFVHVKLQWNRMA